MNKRGCIFILFSLILIAVSGLSQNFYETGTFFIDNYTPKDYDADPQNWAAVKDPRGVMYIANSEGILEYDGISWRKHSILTQIVRGVNINCNGIIYAGGYDNFGYFKADSAGKQHYISLAGDVSGQYTVTKILTQEKTVYFLCDNKIILFKDNRVEATDAALVPGYGFSLTNGIFIITSKRGILGVTGAREKLQILPGTVELIKNAGNVVIATYSDNELLICTEKKGFFIYNLKNFLTGGGNTVHDSLIIRNFATDADKYILHNSDRKSVV